MSKRQVLIPVIGIIVMTIISRVVTNLSIGSGLVIMAVIMVPFIVSAYIRDRKGKRDN